MDSAEEQRAPQESGIESPYGVLSRTWELELLISGAVVFALLQAPPHVDAAYARIEPHIPPAFVTVGMLGFMYSKSILYALIGAFLVHLTARAYWVGLIGLDSVFPQGIQWERSRYGDITRDMFERRVGPLPKLIATVDNVCSAIFGFAFVAVFSLILSVVIASAAILLALLVDRVFLGGSRFAEILPFTLLGLALYPVILFNIDRRIGRRITGRSRTVIQKAVKASFVYQMFPLIGPGLLTLLTNVRRRVMMPIFFGAMFGILGFVVLELFMRREIISFNSDAFVPEASANNVDYKFYATRRGEEVEARYPFIQTDVITDPYIRLVIPYFARRDESAIRRGCPAISRERLHGSESEVADPANAQALLECVKRLRAVKLDGVEPAALQFQFFRDPETGLNGFVSYIPSASLTKGAHVLSIAQMTRDPAEGAPLPPYRIWFWI